jgi:hypothetical protein
VTSMWIFNGDDSRFPGGVFSSRENAEAWIAKHRLSGVLTAYPVDTGVYDWAVQAGRFDRAKEVSPKLVGGFSSAYQEHYHYVDGAAE